jgi:hypothetical protein
MGDGGLAAAFKALAVDAVRTARDIAHSAADIAEKTADIEERNLRNLLESDARAADAFNKIGREPEGGFTGAGHIEQSSRAAEDAYAAIRADAGDVSSIATNTGIDEDVVAQVKKHLFLTEHDVPVGPGQVRSGYFTADERIAELWNKAGREPLKPDDLNELRSLMSHEYVESRLMESGMPYRSADPESWEDGEIIFNPQHFGAHEAAPTASAAAMRHWRALGLTPPDEPIAPDLSNIDNVVDAARRGLGK